MGEPWEIKMDGKRAIGPPVCRDRVIALHMGTAATAGKPDLGS
jgi:hypothetical protein